MNARPPAISVQNLGKRYRIGGKRGRQSLRSALSQAASSWLHAEDSVWVLKGVSFDVQPGEAVGVIGRNGAGKSTLMKVLSRITDPTEGRAELRGRIASLLEVGTGFHPELTGRENIYLNGVILGMKKSEIDRKFDKITAFSDVERFLDTPVKRYSSGMYVRLAFSVAAHVEPDILLVDEVLAVGDQDFRMKCLEKISEMTKAGRTILYISHNLDTVRALCPRTLLLDAGSIRFDGPTDKAIEIYMRSESQSPRP